MSILEVAVVLAMIAVVLAVAVPRFTSRPLHLTADTQEFAANLEVTRGNARSRAELGGNALRYRLRVANATQYVIERGELSGAVWSFAVERTVTLRRGTGFASGSVGQLAAFDSRGRLVGATVTFTIEDAGRGVSKQVVVRPTGSVEIL